MSHPSLIIYYSKGDLAFISPKPWPANHKAAKALHYPHYTCWPGHCPPPGASVTKLCLCGDRHTPTLARWLLNPARQTDELSLAAHANLGAGGGIGVIGGGKGCAFTLIERPV